jgi:hypothetical protein
MKVILIHSSIRFPVYADPLPGKTKDDETVTGTINIPEVAHDTEEDEYVVCYLRTPRGFLYNGRSMLNF